MTKLQKKLFSAISASALLMQLFGVSLVGAVSCSVVNNGSGSTNTCDFASLRDVDVDQDNDADVDNDVDMDLDTGDNEAENNTGGEQNIETGNIDSDTTIVTSVNVNHADVAGSNVGNDYEMEIRGNGSDSDNDIDFDITYEVDIDQDNDADVDNDVDVDADTGDNEIEDATGGDSSIDTGHVESTVTIMTLANANSAVVSGDDEGGSLSAIIRGNGSDSDNDIDFALLSDFDVDQDNDADVDNDVDVDADTGDNEIEDATGGESEILTGNVDVDVAIDTMVNFNQANVLGGYLSDIELEVAKNGSDTDNLIELDLTDEVDVDQDNDADVDNDVDVDADTGDNEVEGNTADGDDPAVDTGKVESTVSLSTSGNANAYGGDVDLEFDWELDELMDLLRRLAALLEL